MPPPGDDEASGPGAEASFTDRYEHLVYELSGLLDSIPQVEQEPLGPAGLRIRCPPTEREVRITPLEDQRLVHFVFGHATLGTLHRAEHHASRPFGDRPPEVQRLLHQLLAFLLDGVEPKWLAHRPPPEPGTVRERAPGHDPDADDALELPLD